MKHGTKGYQKGCKCDVCKKAMSDYQRAYREKNRERIAKQKAENYQKNREARAAYNRAYREQNREQLAERMREWNDQNREWKAAYSREYRERNYEHLAERGREYYDQNRDKKVEYTRKWRERNPARAREAVAAYQDKNREEMRKYHRETHAVDPSRQQRRLKEIDQSLLVTRRGCAWTPEEDEVVLREDLSVLECVVLLQRSYSSIVAHRHTLRGKRTDRRRINGA